MAIQQSISSIQKKYKLQKKKLEQEIETTYKDIQCMEIEIKKKNDENLEYQERIKDEKIK